MKKHRLVDQSSFLQLSHKILCSTWHHADKSQCSVSHIIRDKYLECLSALLQCLLPARAKRSSCYVLYMPLVDQALPMPLNIGFLFSVSDSVSQKVPKSIR